MTTPPIHIHSVGMACPIGLTALSACAAMRANISRRAELAYLDNDGEPIVGSALRTLPAGLQEPRWWHLLAHALRDVLASEAPGRPGELAIIVVPAARGAPRDGELARFLAAELGGAFARAGLHVMHGIADGNQAIVRAREVLLRGQARRCIVCTADSLVDARSLLALSRHDRLKTPNHTDGLIPGEAAACLALGLDPHGALATIRGIGVGREQGLLSNDIPLSGDGIAAAARGALAEAGREMHDIDFRVSDATGEAYYFKEQVLMVSRLLRRNLDALPLWLVARTLGHVGVAAGMCGVVWATMAFSRRYAPGPRALALSGADDGHRVAMVLEGPRGG